MRCMAPFAKDAFVAFGCAIHQVVHLKFAHNAIAPIVPLASFAAEPVTQEKRHLTEFDDILLRANGNLGATAFRAAGLRFYV